jgi:hypothetical protein
VSVRPESGSWPPSRITKSAQEPLFVVIMAMLGLASQSRWVPWARHWPLGFIALGVFIVLRSDAEDSWPFGHMGFWEGLLSNDAILLHRLEALIACALGLIAWRARVTSMGGATHRSPMSSRCYVR